VILDHLAQAIEWDQAGELMDVVDADSANKAAQDAMPPATLSAPAVQRRVTDMPAGSGMAVEESLAATARRPGFLGVVVARPASFR